MTRNHLWGVFALAFLLIGNPATAQSQQDPGAIEAAPAEPSEATTLYREGDSLLAEEDAEGALSKYEEGLEADPESAFNAYGKGRALARLGEYEKAYEALELAAELAPTEESEELEEAIESLTEQVSRRLGQSAYRRAVDEINSGQELTPETAEGVLPLLETAEAYGVEASGLPYNLARVYNALGRHEEALPYAEAAVEANRSEADPSAYYLELGIAKMNIGDEAGAREAFENARGGAWGSWAEHYLGQLEAE